MKNIFFFFLLFLFTHSLFSQGERKTIDLNGIWDFDQTYDAFPPKQFTRKCPVPGLIHLAEPKVEDYDKFFRKATLNETIKSGIVEPDYTPKYSWYKKSLFIPTKYDGHESYISLKKSKYVTHIYVNGIEVGNSIAFYTPIDVNITHALKVGEENEIMIRLGDWAWLPSESPGSLDFEKQHYIPGIWDDVLLSFTKKFRIHRALFLPSVRESKVTAKLQILNFYKPRRKNQGADTDSTQVKLIISEKKSLKKVVEFSTYIQSRKDNITEVSIELPMENPHLWNTDDPFLYTVNVELYDSIQKSDQVIKSFGMRDFGKDGKHFTLNGEKTYLRGSNITLHRFFEDPESANLPWDREWVTKLLSENPKKLNWNAMRISLGALPDFWYDIADSCGLLLQNEWFYWKTHGWDNQTKMEYSDWVWNDGSHPSIVIWDAINENRDDYIGTTLIPELKKIDPTRLWDAGFMTGVDDLDEPHPYKILRVNWTVDYVKFFKENLYDLGRLDNWSERETTEIINSNEPQLVNEYAWIWLWRDGNPAHLTKKHFKYFAGENASVEQNREMQAYWMQCETEWLRAERSLAGILPFAYLTNNFGFTGDWFIGPIKELNWGPTMSWFKHCFSPAAVFIDLADQRYMKHIPALKPKTKLDFNLVAVNDNSFEVNGDVDLKLLDPMGNEVLSKNYKIQIDAYGKQTVPASIQLPSRADGYLVLTEFHCIEQDPVISRRYIKVGNKKSYMFFDQKP